MVQAPEFDLLPFLDQDDNWDVELYTERTVETLLQSADRFDCIVVGYNAAYKSPRIRAALRDAALRGSGQGRTGIPLGLLVLHQLKPEALSFLADEPLIAERLGEPARGAASLREADAHDEILLNWPYPVALPSDEVEHSTAYVGVTPAAGSNWRTVLEVRSDRRRVPVLVRTASHRWPPRAVSTVLLAPRHPSHLALLCNLLMWCAAGRPDAVVVDSPDGPPAEIVHRKLRLQGVKAVVERVATRPDLDFQSWPLWGTRDALLPESWDPTGEPGWPREDPHDAKTWLRRGHRIILLGPGDSLTVRHGESDSHWVARRWAAWFRGVPTVVWHGGDPDDDEHAGSIVATRSVLRMLAALHGVAREARVPGLGTAHLVLDELTERGLGIDAHGLGLPEPKEFTEPVARLLRRRIGDSDNVEGTVSATVAALDIDALLGGRALPGERREALFAWLRRVSPESALEDRLEIARCLGDAEHLEEVVAGAAEDSRVDQPVSAVLVTSLRSAIVACGRRPEASLAPFSLDPERAVVDRELRMRPMLAAGYLIGVLDLQRVWGAQPEEPARTLRDPPPERVDRAVITLGRHGPLSRDDRRRAGAVPELASTEAIALIAYFARHPVPTHVISGGEAVPPEMVGSLLREAEKVRRENEALDHQLKERVELARRGGRALAIAGEALILALVALFAVVLVPKVNATWGLPSAFVLWTILTLALLALLGKYRLPVRGAARIAPWLGGGLDAVRADLARSVASGSEAARRDEEARGRRG
jgi:hypothetical protein